jgi:peroxiredoxin
LSDLQGAPIVVTFFTTWCADCRSGMAALNALASQTGGAARVVGIDLQESAERVHSFVRDYGLTFPVLLDTGDVASTWRVGGRNQPLPATFFIDERGVVRKAIAGPASTADLEQGLSLVRGGR